MMNFNKIKYSVFCILLSTFLSSCSQFSMAYRFADWILAYQLDSYFDLDFQQEQWTDDVLDEWHLWHRQNELPYYASIIKQVQQNVNSGITNADVVWLQNEAEEIRRRLAVRVLPEIATFLLGLKPEQITYYKAELAERGQERTEERNQLTHEEWRTEKIAKFIDNLDNFIGELTAEQQQLVEQQNFWNLEILTVYRERRALNRQRFFNAFENAGSKAELTAALLEQWTKPEKFYTPVYAQWTQQRREEYQIFIVEMVRSLTAKQREFLHQELEEIRQILLNFAS